MILVENKIIQRNELVPFVALSHFQVTFSTDFYTLRVFPVWRLPECTHIYWGLCIWRRVDVWPMWFHKTWKHLLCNCLHGRGKGRGKKFTSLFQTHEVYRIVYSLGKFPFQASWALIDGMCRVLIVDRRSWEVQSMAHSTGQCLLGIMRDTLHEVWDLY